MKKINLYYWNGQSNFGDLLNIDIMATVFGLTAIYTSTQQCKMICIGSVLDKFIEKKKFYFSRFFSKPVSPVHVYGSGFIRPAPKYSKLTHPLIVHAVRGYISLERLKGLGVNPPGDVVIGDPGLLASLLLQKPVSKQYKIGIIPHHKERALPLFKEIVNGIKGSKIIDATMPVMDVVKEIAQCETVLSTSLHGLIVADSFGIPNRWAIASDLLSGGNYKFWDYYSAYGITEPQGFDLRVNAFQDSDVAAIANNYQIQQHDVEQKRQRLIISFPKEFL